VSSFIRQSRIADQEFGILNFRIFLGWENVRCIHNHSHLYVIYVHVLPMMCWDAGVALMLQALLGPGELQQMTGCCSADTTSFRKSICKHFITFPNKINHRRNLLVVEAWFWRMSALRFSRRPFPQGLGQAIFWMFILFSLCNLATSCCHQHEMDLSRDSGVARVEPVPSFVLHWIMMSWMESPWPSPVFLWRSNIEKRTMKWLN
jgi:hypothetical protein